MVDATGNVAPVAALMQRGAAYPDSVRVHKCRLAGRSAPGYRLRCRVALANVFGQRLDRSATFDVRGGVVVRGGIH